MALFTDLIESVKSMGSWLRDRHEKPVEHIRTGETQVEYKGYLGLIVRGGDPAFFGRVINIKDVITFEGSTIREAVKAMEDSVDDYLAFCKKHGREPERGQPHD